MIFFFRCLVAFSAGIGRKNVSSIQRKLRFHLANSEINIPRVKELIGEICTAAWNIEYISRFFKKHDFSFEDYVSMYTAMILSFPHIETKGKILLATNVMVDSFSKLEPLFNSLSIMVSNHEMVDNFSKIDPRFYSLGQNVFGIPGGKRSLVLGKLLIDSFKDLMMSRPDLFAA